MFSVTFNTGCELVEEEQKVQENSLATEPQKLYRPGYEFLKWDYDFIFTKVWYNLLTKGVCL